MSEQSRGAEGHLYRLKAREIWEFLLRQPLSYWFICGYLFFEYVRPQVIYPAIEDWPLPQAFLLLSVGALLAEGKLVRRFNWADGTLIFFGIVVFASASLAWNPSYAFHDIKVVVNWLLVYYLITTLVDTEKRFLVFMFSFLLYSLKMSQHATRSWALGGFDFRAWGVAGAPGWFTNSGEFAIQMTIFIPLAVYFILALRKHWERWKVWLMWLVPVTGVIGILASSSRGGQLGLVAVVVVMAAKSRKKVRALGALVLVVVSAFLLLPEQQIERFESIGEDDTSQSRLIYWDHAIEITNRHPVLGIGYDNWIPYYRTYYNPGGELPHSIYLEAASELGYTGVFAFLLLIGATLYLNRRTRRIALRCRGDPSFLYYMAHGLDVALVGFLASGAFVTVLFYPFLWINLAMTSSLYTVARKKLAARGQAWVRERTLTDRSRRAPAAAPASGE